MFGKNEYFVYLFAKYRNANMLPRAKSANPKVNFSIPESSPTRPSCLRCLKYNVLMFKSKIHSTLYIITQKPSYKSELVNKTKTKAKLLIPRCLQTLKFPTILLAVSLMIAWHVPASSGFWDNKILKYYSPSTVKQHPSRLESTKTTMRDDGKCFFFKLK